MTKLESVYRCYVEKRPGFDVAAKALEAELSGVLSLPGVGVRLFNRYDLQGLPQERWMDIVNIVLSEPASDVYYENYLPTLPAETRLLYAEPLPGQFDVRADSCEQCVQMLLGGERPVVRTARVYAISGVCDAGFERIKTYLINPLEYREASPEMPDTLLRRDSRPPDDIPEVAGFNGMDAAGLEELQASLGLAMSIPDLLALQNWFQHEKRDPTLTELRVLDTYWSDHCRHTTFNTIIESCDIQDKRVKKAYDQFLSVNGKKPVTLMRIATAAMRHLHKRGDLPMLDVSDENNACTVRIKADLTHGQEDWLLFFKNETHNHPTEIEPYGGASTCIGGAIRDPLSGRAYVYQAMRITGAGDPRKPIEDTLPGKLPQRKLTVTAAEGFSSYGNQIGLATGFVKELYHDGYVAKRLEAGAVVGAAQSSSVRRECPSAGDIVVLLGGRTGRDGIGGATGSSKTHGVETVSECASEVQKGNAPEERKLQRLFRNPDVTKIIKRCNDFGAGGVAVAIGEIADGVEINLDAIPVKYDGLNGTELAISESQERMAVVVAESDLVSLLSYAESENIEASAVARITESRRLVMMWRGKKIVDIDRDFLDTNGAERYATVYVPPATIPLCGGVTPTGGGVVAPATGSEVVAPATGGGVVAGGRLPPLQERLLQLCGDLNFCSQKGLVERFDHSIGAASVFMPFGGKYALTETQVMAALLPVTGARTASVMAYGFDPYFTETDPFGGSAYAVVTSVAKLIASGVTLDTIHLSLQEYFPRLGDDPTRWGQPFSAMLGAFSAQLGLQIAAIGGKDSMSGSYTYLSPESETKTSNIPPTLISFAVGVSDVSQLISPEFKGAGHPVYLLETPMCADGLPDYPALRDFWDEYAQLCRAGKVLSAWACETGGVYGGILKMALGNMIGFSGSAEDCFFDRSWGCIIVESTEKLEGFRLLGYTKDAPTLTFGEATVPLTKLRTAWEAPLETVFPVKTEQNEDAADTIGAQQGGSPYADTPNAQQGGSPHTDTPGDLQPSSHRDLPFIVTDGHSPLRRDNAKRRGDSLARPKAVIPIFPGTNCEYDTASAIERAGGICEVVPVRNLTPDMLLSSIAALEKAIATAQMIVFPGGFSGGDEPDGSGKFIVSLFRNPRLTDAVHELLHRRDGLILGICNGFQALIKLGLLPYGKITTMTPDCPTLTFNRIGRHQSRYVSTRVASAKSPWLSKCDPGEIFIQPISHGEGRFAASAEVLEMLKANSQIAFQYVDHDGNPSMDIAHNPNGSARAVEGICSPDGRVLGKMAHSERYGEYTALNIPGNKFLPLFEGGVGYFE